MQQHEPTSSGPCMMVQIMILLDLVRFRYAYIFEKYEIHLLTEQY